MNNVNFGVIGAGHIGKRHMEMIRRKEGFSLVAFADIRSKEACEVDGDVPHYSDHKAMLKHIRNWMWCASARPMASMPSRRLMPFQAIAMW